MVGISPLLFLVDKAQIGYLKKIKIRTAGWYSHNTNLQRWQPYLTRPPIAKGLLLSQGAEFWNNKSHWYQCSSGSSQ